jgi:hypothetical protein
MRKTRTVASTICACVAAMAMVATLAVPAAAAEADRREAEGAAGCSNTKCWGHSACVYDAGYECMFPPFNPHSCSNAKCSGGGGGGQPM